MKVDKAWELIVAFNSMAFISDFDKAVSVSSGEKTY